MANNCNFANTNLSKFEPAPRVFSFWAIFFSFFNYRKHSESGSALRKTAGSGFAKKECGSTALVNCIHTGSVRLELVPTFLSSLCWGVHLRGFWLKSANPLATWRPYSLIKCFGHLVSFLSSCSSARLGKIKELREKDTSIQYTRYIYIIHSSQQNRGRLIDTCRFLTGK